MATHTGNAKSGFRADLGYIVRSRWEANVARYLKLIQLPFHYEPHKFILKTDEGTIGYIPDFQIAPNLYLEVKGHVTQRTKLKHNLFRSQYSHIRLLYITEKEYLIIYRFYSHLIPNWEYDKTMETRHAILKELESKPETRNYPVQKVLEKANRKKARKILKAAASQISEPEAVAALSLLVGKFCEAGYRLTKPRLAVIRVLHSADRPLITSEIIKIGRKFHESLVASTTLITLEILIGLGLASKTPCPNRTHLYILLT